MPIGGMSFVKEWMVGCENSENGEKGGNGGMLGMVGMAGMELMAHQSNCDHKYKLTILYSLSTLTKST